MQHALICHALLLAKRVLQDNFYALGLARVDILPESGVSISSQTMFMMQE